MGGGDAVILLTDHPTLGLSSCRINSDTVDYDDACLIVRYLASMRPFAQSFDIYLTQVRGRGCFWFRLASCYCIGPLSRWLKQALSSLSMQILRVLGESAIAVRTKAMKCLSEVVAVDPSILARVSTSARLWSFD